MAVQISPQAFRKLFLSAFTNGKPETVTFVSRQHVVWQLHGSCSMPKGIVLESRTMDGTYVGCAQLRVRCGKCERCQAAWQARWCLRMKNELQNCSRAWFITLTFGPGFRKRVTAFDPETGECMSNDEIVREAKKETIDFYKRLRKQYPVKFKYFQAMEYHKDGIPHFHILLHEYGPVLLKREIQSKWTAGFSTCKLTYGVPDKIANYVGKYLTKDGKKSRVQVSRKYGKGPGENPTVVPSTPSGTAISVNPNSPPHTRTRSVNKRAKRHVAEPQKGD